MESPRDRSFKLDTRSGGPYDLASDRVGRAPTFWRPWWFLEPPHPDPMRQLSRQNGGMDFQRERPILGRSQRTSGCNASLLCGASARPHLPSAVFIFGFSAAQVSSTSSEGAVGPTA